MVYDVEKIKRDFPSLSLKVNNNPLVYLDNAATVQRPLSVIKAVENYSRFSNGNPHRGAHYLSIESTRLYENSKEKVRNFINAGKVEEIIYTKNATEAINLVAYSYGLNFISSGDEIVIAISEHHSNILPWQMVCKAKGATLKYLYLDENYRIPESEVNEKITSKTKLVAVAHMSNVLGTIHDVKSIVKAAHKVGAVTLIDGSQSAPHIKVDVKGLDADFYVFSGHKMLSSMGIGVLYGKEKLLNIMPPFLSGGDMIEYVEETTSTFAPIPFKFEAGTQNVDGAVSLASAIDYINEIGIENIEKHENEITNYALSKMKEIDYITIYGPEDLNSRGGLISFNINSVHPHDASSILNEYGVAVRAGHHCAQPLMKYINVNSCLRISFYLYTTKEDIDIFIESLDKVRRWLGYGESKYNIHRHNNGA